jgi:hypothetical protein
LIPDKEDRTLYENHDKKDGTSEEGSGGVVMELSHIEEDNPTQQNTDKSSEVDVAIVDVKSTSGELLDVNREISDMPGTNEPVTKVHMEISSGAIVTDASSASATDACMNDVSDMKISDTNSVNLGSISSVETARQHEDIIVVNSLEATSEKPSDLVTIDLTSDSLPSNDNLSRAADIIDLTVEERAVGRSCSGPVIDLTQDSTDHESSKISSRRPRRPPMAVYVPPRGRGPPSGSGVPPLQVKPTITGTGTFTAPTVDVSTKAACGVDVTEQVLVRY